MKYLIKHLGEVQTNVSMMQTSVQMPFTVNKSHSQDKIQYCGIKSNPIIIYPTKGKINIWLFDILKRIISKCFMISDTGLYKQDITLWLVDQVCFIEKGNLSFDQNLQKSQQPKLVPHKLQYYSNTWILKPKDIHTKSFQLQERKFLKHKF
eukprot:c23130_g1_i3 orf=307-759(-)